MMAERLELKDFGVSNERGFLPDEDPLTQLPAHYAAWEELAAELPRWLSTGRFRERARALPELDAARLVEPREQRRAMLLLSFLSHAYVWCDAKPAQRLPAVLARPWSDIASELGRPPVLSYASYALDNWRRLDPHGPIEIGNLGLLQNFLGGVDEDWFILIHVEIEARAAQVLGALPSLLEAASDANTEQAQRSLTVVAGGIAKLVQTLERMPEFCDPYIYYHRVRPFIHGWKGHPAFETGLIYEGVSERGEKAVALRGETGAQSSIVPALDATFGVQHATDPLREYLTEMRDYMPPDHRRLLAFVEKESRVREVVSAAAADSLRGAYDECLLELESFRSLHLEYAARYIFQQAQTDSANPAKVGTGGTPFMPYLKKHRDETNQQRFGPGPTKS